MTVPVSQVLEQVRRKMYGSRRFEVNYLSAGITAGATMMTLTDTMGGLTRNSYCGIDSELVYVREVSGQTATIRRGMMGTTAASHASDAEVEVSPRFFRGDILDNMKDEIVSWGPDLYQIATLALSTSNAYPRGYDLAVGTFYNVLEVRHAPYTSTPTTWPIIRDFDVDRKANATAFPSGVALYIGDQLRQAVALKVVYSVPFTTTAFTEATDLIATVGLEESYLDILRFGTMWRLMSGMEVVRTDAVGQAEPRMATEEPPMFRTQTAKSLKSLRDDRIAEERIRLVKRWGLRGA